MPKGEFVPLESGVKASLRKRGACVVIVGENALRVYIMPSEWCELGRPPSGEENNVVCDQPRREGSQKCGCRGILALLCYM